MDFVSLLGIGHRREQQWVLRPGAPEGGPDNRHRAADQWLFVAAGTGVAIINGENLVLRTGTLMLIEAGDTHQIRNTGRGLRKTVSVYVPPACDNDDQELPFWEP